MANNAFDQANSAFNLAHSAFDQANSANGLAQAAFHKANTAPGEDQWIIYNDNGSYGADNGLMYDRGAQTLRVENLQVQPGTLNVSMNITTGGDVKPITQGQNLGGLANRWYNLYLDGGIYTDGSFGKQGQVLTTDGYGTITWADPAVSANGAITPQLDTYGRTLANSASIVANTALTIAQEAMIIANAAKANGGGGNVVISGPATSGENQWVQFNDNGTTSSNAQFLYDKAAATLHVKNLKVDTGIINVASYITTGGDLVPFTPGQNIGRPTNRWYDIYMDGGIYAQGNFGLLGQVLTSDEYGTVTWQNVSNVLANSKDLMVPVEDASARADLAVLYRFANNTSNLAHDTSGRLNVLSDTIYLTRDTAGYAFQQANSANLTAYSSFYQANLAYEMAVSANNLATAAYNRFNSSNVYVRSNVTSILPGGTLKVDVNMANTAYPGGLFTIYQEEPVVITMSNLWNSTGEINKNAYINAAGNIVNTSDIRLNLSVQGDTFSIKTTDSLTIGDKIITGSDITSLGISGSGGQYTIPSRLLTNYVQTSPTCNISTSLSTTRKSGVTANGTMLLNRQPIPFNVEFANCVFANTSVPFFDLNLPFSWEAKVTGRVESGLVVYSLYSGGPTIVLTGHGQTSGTSGLIKANAAYIISSFNYVNGYNNLLYNIGGYRGEGLYGAGTTTIPNTVTTIVQPAPAYYPMFWKVTQTGDDPQFTKNDPRYGMNYALGQGAYTTDLIEDYLWIAIPGTADHTFGFNALGTIAVEEPDAQYLGVTIEGHPYNVYGFTNFLEATNVYTTS